MNRRGFIGTLAAGITAAALPSTEEPKVVTEAPVGEFLFRHDGTVAGVYAGDGALVTQGRCMVKIRTT